MSLKFKNDSNIIIYGCSGSGKTEFVKQVLVKRLISNFPTKIYYHYHVRQDWIEPWNKHPHNPSVQFIQGVPDVLNISDCIAIFDDLMLNDLNTIAGVFVFGSHHKRISSIFITQNLYPKSDMFRLMLLNSHYLILFADIRSNRQVKLLGSQMFDKTDRLRLYNAYSSAIKEPFGFVILNFVKHLPRELTVLTNYWKEISSVYL